MSDPDKTVSGDSDTWMLFERTTSDGFPLVVLARTGNSLVDEVLRSGCVTIVECQPDPSIINDRRMPQHTDRIYPVEDGLVELLAGTGALHIASVTGDGLRRVFYAHTDPIDFPVMVQRFVVQEYILRAERAENLADWAPVISPTEIDRQLNGDRGVIAQLEDAGDTLTTPRKVDFWAYGDRSSLTNFARELGSWDFEIDHWTDGEDGSDTRLARIDARSGLRHRAHAHEAELTSHPACGLALASCSRTKARRLLFMIRQADLGERACVHPLGRERHLRLVFVNAEGLAADAQAHRHILDPDHRRRADRHRPGARSSIIPGARRSRR